MTPYDQGYQDAIRHIYTALGMAITQPLDEDHALGYLKILKRERDEARAAYEAETLSTAQMASECTRLHGLWHAAEERGNKLDSALRGLMSAEEATIDEFNAEEIDALEAAMDTARRALGILGQNAESEGPPPSRPEFKQEASGGSLH